MEGMCRLCLVTSKGEDIFKKGFDRVIKDYFGIKLRIIPKWPSHACKSCINYLKGLKDFRATIKASQEHLKQLEAPLEVKAEPITVIYIGKQAIVEEPDGNSYSEWEPEDPSDNEEDEEVYNEEESEKERSPTPPTAPDTHAIIIPNKEIQSPTPICDICGKWVKTMKDLKAHKQIHIATECLTCGKTFLDIQTHNKQVHGINSMVKCKQCGKRMKKKTYRQHLSLHANEAPRKCGVCRLKFRTYNSYKQHMEIHRPTRYRCFFCGSQYSSTSERTRHMQQTHEVEYQNFQRTKSISKAQECGICKKRFPDLTRHMKYVHRPSATTVICEHCGDPILETLYQRHLKMHQVRKPQTYKCNVCDKESSRWQLHRIHMEVHMGIKHSCHFCGLEISSWTSRHKHMKLKHFEEYMEYRNNPLNKVRIRRPKKKIPEVVEENCEIIVESADIDEL